MAPRVTATAAALSESSPGPVPRTLDQGLRSAIKGTPVKVTARERATATETAMIKETETRMAMGTETEMAMEMETVAEMEMETEMGMGMVAGTGTETGRAAVAETGMGREAVDPWLSEKSW